MKIVKPCFHSAMDDDEFYYDGDDTLLKGDEGAPVEDSVTGFTKLGPGLHVVKDYKKLGFNEAFEARKNGETVYVDGQDPRLMCSGELIWSTSGIDEVDGLSGETIAMPDVPGGTLIVLLSDD